MKAIDYFKREVENLKRATGMPHHEAWTKKKSLMPEVYAAMERDGDYSEGIALANAREVAGSAGPLDTMIPDWAYKLAKVSSGTYDDFRAAVAERGFPAERIGSLLTQAADWLKSNRKLQHT